MIVKISKEEGWAFYDGFSSVDYERVDEAKSKQYRCDAEWFTGKKGCGILMVLCHKESRDEHSKFAPTFSIKTDNITYLCNDKGETIERIN